MLQQTPAKTLRHNIEARRVTKKAKNYSKTALKTKRIATKPLKATDVSLETAKIRPRTVKKTLSL